MLDNDSISAAPSATPILRFTGVSKSYGRTQALRDVSFSLNPSETVGLLGPNGAGKSTLFQVAAGLFAPDAGTVEVFGLDYKRHSSTILKDIGVVFQSRSLDLDMTVTSNLKFHGGLFGLSGKPLAERIDELAGMFDFRDLLKKPVRTLSGGNQRRVEIARALLNRPHLLLMDEPSSGLDAASRRALVTHLYDVCRQQATSILWSTHLVDEVEAANRILVINAGQIVAEGAPAALLAETGARDLVGAYTVLTGGNRDEGAEDSTA